jgi:hypothetical protein
MEAAIRGALDKAGIPGAQARRRIYDSARAALDRSLERQGITDPERVDDHRHRLELLIAEIEAEWTPPAAEEPAPEAAAPSVELPADTGPGEAEAPATPRPVYDVEAVLGPEHDQPEVAHVSRDNTAAGAEAPQQARTGREFGVAAPERTGCGRQSDFAPDAREHEGAGAPVSVTAEERPAHIKAPASRFRKTGQEGQDPKTAQGKALAPGVCRDLLGGGDAVVSRDRVWWLIESGALKSAAERDTGVPNPPPSLSRDDFAGGPQQLNPGSGFSGSGPMCSRPAATATPEVRGNARAEVIEERKAMCFGFRRAAATQVGRCWCRLAPKSCRRWPGGNRCWRSDGPLGLVPETTQIYVKCEFSVLGDCGRRRFDVTYDTTDILFSLDYDRALAPNEGGIPGDQQRHIRRRQGHRPAGGADPSGELICGSRTHAVLPTTQAKNRPLF